MPNYRIPAGILEEIRTNAIALACRPVKNHRIRFPLTNDEVQELVMPPEPLAMCRALKDISGLSRTSSTVIRINRTPATATRVALQRDVALDVQCIDIYYMRHLAYFSRIRAENIEHARKDSYYEAMTEHLSDESWNRLVKWTHTMVTLARREQLVIWFIDEMMRDLTDTTTLYLLWPLLATFTEDDRWRHRINTVAVRNTARYLPDSHKSALLNKYKAAVEEILADCSLTDKAPGTAGKRHANLPAWQRLEGEWEPGKI